MNIITLRNDATELARAFTSVLFNPKTGMGTARDKTQYSAVNTVVLSLTRMELSALYRKSGIIQRAVNTYPADGAQGWVKLNFGSAKNVKPSDVEQYFRDRNLKIKQAFYKASLYSRWHGDGFILLGIADGKKTEDEVEKSNIYSIRGFKPVSRWQLRPEVDKSFLGDRSDPEYYTLNVSRDTLQRFQEEGLDGVKWHKSRVIRIMGTPLDEEGLNETGGFNDSIIQSMFDSFCAYTPGMQSASIMIQDHRVRKYGIKGLANLISGQQSATVSTNQNGKDTMQALIERMVANDLARSVARSEVFDPDTETLDNLTNDYGGVEGILSKLLEAWAMDTDMSRLILYNLLGSNGLASGEAFKFARLDHAYRLNSWMENKWRDSLEYIYELAMLAQDSFSRGAIVDGWSIEIPILYKMTPEEKLALQEQAARRDSSYISLGVYSPRVAAQQFASPDFDPNILLDLSKPVPAEIQEEKEEEQKKMEAQQAAIAEEGLE